MPKSKALKTEEVKKKRNTNKGKKLVDAAEYNKFLGSANAAAESLTPTIPSETTPKFIPRRVVFARTERLYNDGTREIDEQTYNTNW